MKTILIFVLTLSIISKTHFHRNNFIQKKSYSQTFKHDTLEVMTQDLVGKYGEVSLKWDEAKSICEHMGNGWRLPTKDELNMIYQNRNKFSFLEKYATYWTSTEYISEYVKNSVWTQDFVDGFQGVFSKSVTKRARAVRDK